MANKKQRREMLLCFTGMPGSGKTTAAEIMRRKGYRVVEMHSGVLELMKKKGVEINNHNVRQFSTEIRKKRGNDIVARLTGQLVSKIKGHVAIFGVRGVREVKYFKKRLRQRDVYLVALILPQKLRFKRIQAERRKRKDETRTWAEFVERDKIEIGWGLREAIENADFLISNYGTKSDLLRSVSKLIGRISAPK